eukprot:GHUV01033929.1.p1 GENE.GHUV01033929.1~~GHUV01033929.1.p1  ORF type:complete len:138 (-),score=8.79 GHUV01033929.1:435-848(-)
MQYGSVVDCRCRWHISQMLLSAVLLARLAYVEKLAIYMPCVTSQHVSQNPKAAPAEVPFEHGHKTQLIHYICLCAHAGFSAVPIFTTLLISTFNMIFTACPIVAFAVIEQDLHKDTILANPETYASSRTATKRNTLW